MLNRSLASILVFSTLIASAQAQSSAAIGGQSTESVLKGVLAIESEYDAQDAAVNMPLSTDAVLTLDSPQVMALTARFSPRIRRARERKAAEEARYDFFIYNREALSYGASAPLDYNRYNSKNSKYIEKVLSPQVFVRKEFYNTARAAVNVGYGLTDYQDGHAANAFVSTTLSVPLFASREALQRSNDKIYQQNKVNDARLEYYQQIRWQISEALYQLNWTQNHQNNLASEEVFRADLEELLKIVSSVAGRDTSGDAAKVQATLASASAECKSSAEEFKVTIARLCNTMGIPFNTQVKVAENNFALFEGEKRDDLERVAIETDEEIKTLLNSIRNAQLELDLARKGKWDTTLTVGASRDFAGSGDLDRDQGYSLTAGVEVTHIDNRISKSLEQIALANIREYKNAIVNRRGGIRTDIMDAYTSMKSGLAELRSREGNISKFVDDYRKGVELYKAGTLSIDSLLQRRKDLLNEQYSITEARDRAHDATVSLISSTGRYEQFIGSDNAATGGTANPAKAAPAVK